MVALPIAQPLKPDMIASEEAQSKEIAAMKFQAYVVMVTNQSMKTVTMVTL